jgi:hypothetical protein
MVNVDESLRHGAIDVREREPAYGAYGPVVLYAVSAGFWIALVRVDSDLLDRTFGQSSVCSHLVRERQREEVAQASCRKDGVRLGPRP